MSGEEDPRASEGKFEKGSGNDCSKGPMGNRGCTDAWCCILFLAMWVLFVFITLMGMQDGNPAQLYRPRDYAGQYCGNKENWNKGMNLEGWEKLTYMMNVTETVDDISKQFMCSSLGESTIRTVWGASGSAPNAAALANYECACCKIPCGTCTGSLDLANVATVNDIPSMIGSKMADLTSPTSGNLFDPSSANGDFFSNIWSQATKYFVPVCTTSCGALTVAPNRTYTYVPAADSALYDTWRTLTQAASVPTAVKTAMKDQFTFKALPKTVCPYGEQFCVPFPGVQFKDTAAGYCMFELGAEGVKAIGAAAGKAMTSIGVDKITSNLSQELGNWAGEFVDTIDTFIIVALAAFVIGLIFLILLRFFVGCVVWLAILIIFLLFFLAGALCYVRHTQCKGVGLLESGHHMGTSLATTGLAAAQGETFKNEGMTGTGADYRGFQTRTQTGKICQAWNSSTPWQTAYKSATHPNDGLTKNFCRNPGGKAGTIWCYTTDSAKKWELCNQLGAIHSTCISGYEVGSPDMRKALEIFAFVLWGFAMLWLLAIMCMCRQIFLAIAVNKVAAVFVYNTPSVLLVPLVQSLIGILWSLAWACSAAFLLSQVPDDRVPTAFYATFAEAAGTIDTEGKCNAAFVNGEAYKYPGNPLVANDPCTGNMGDITGIVPKCWACKQPRYVIDYKVAASFFCYLWNNAFLIASGQFIIAVACGVWFFAPREDKGKRLGGIKKGIWWTLRYHCGSIAFGSFIVALVQFIRYALMYFEKQAAAAKNRVAVMVMKVVQCCLWCFEKCIKFLNTNAYIQIALLGNNFCKSAKSAFFLILRNFARFAWIGMLGGIINYIGILFIVAGTAVSGYFILKEMHPEVTPVLPMIVYVVTAYIVARLYMNVFQLAVNTILQCFLATEEMGGDGGWLPSQMQGMVKDMDKDKGAPRSEI